MRDCDRASADGADAGSPQIFDLEDSVDAVRAARHFVEDRVRALGRLDLIDDAGLIAGELLANARQHGMPPVCVGVLQTEDGIRLEVRDASTRMPVRPAPSTSNMTGRGLALVEALAKQWGVERVATGGKVVWADVTATDASAAADALSPDELERMLAAWDDDDAPTAEPRFTVVLGDVPTELLLGAKSHIDNLVREFTLASAAAEGDDVGVTEHLAWLIETVVHGFAEARAAIKRQALAAAQRGEPRTRLTLHLPISAAVAGEAYLAALDEADEYARAARLLTLETPPEHRLFRQWYVQSVVTQLRQVARGEPVTPIVSFESRLLDAVRTLSAARRVGERSMRLQRVSAALVRAHTPEDVAAVVVSEGVAVMGASGGGLLVPAGDGEHLAVPGVVGYGEELVGALRGERIDARLPAATAIRTGEAIWLESQRERDAQFPELRGFESSTVAMCAVPLVIGQRIIGALRFSFNRQKLFDDDERTFVLALAAQTAQTLQRTETYAAEREAALELQRELLPQDILPPAGWDLAAYYSPAGEQEAGGDFYDVIPLPGGRLIAVVGDVMGRGVQAAAAMAQIRSIIRAYVAIDPDPIAVFRKVDAFFAAYELSQLVTAVYLVADSDAEEVTVASAGHLPPLLVQDGGGTVAPVVNGLPFGVLPQPERSVTRVSLPRGSALVFVTDGLVERRGEDIDEGVTAVLRRLAGSAGESAASIMDRVTGTLGPEAVPDDDVTALVLRRS